jgi:alpha-tubulin suppressor-like RCC1 family protein
MNSVKFLIMLIFLFGISSCRLFISIPEEREGCGNQILDPSETCDGTILNGATCIREGFQGGDISCSNLCTLDTSLCSGIDKCGNRLIDSEETCDGPELDEQSCDTLGYYGGTLSCNSECQFELSSCSIYGKCGDGVIQSDEGEICDSDNIIDDTCSSLGHLSGILECTNTCTLDESACHGTCGDSLIQIADEETCDSENLNGQTCETLGHHLGGTLTCDASCILSNSCNSFIKIDTGERHVCGLTTSGDVYCWGDNETGTLGINSTTDSLIPAKIDGFSSFIDITTGDYHSCGIKNNGIAYCWGWNGYGQLGNGTTEDSLVPVALSLLEGEHSFIMLSAGSSHTCGLTTDGEIYCWGWNYSGQLGDETTTNRHVPTLVTSNNSQWGNVIHISAGDLHTCAVTYYGAAFCWGSNGFGRLGIGSTLEKQIPTLVDGNLDFALISAGSYHTCGITISGSAYCWGNNSDGRLGDDTINDKFVPTPVDGEFNFAHITTANYHTCGVTTDKNAYCWGDNSDGRLGDGTTTQHHTPWAISGENSFQKVYAGGNGYSCAMTTTGDVLCWGSNSFGQLGIDSTTDTHLPTLVSGW